VGKLKLVAQVWVRGSMLNHGWCRKGKGNQTNYQKISRKKKGNRITRDNPYKKKKKVPELSGNTN